MNGIMDPTEEIIMNLVHYFVTEENYQPIIVNGTKNEIWLENMDADYKVIRINSNYIHNEEQFRVDNYKINSVVKQIKKKTFLFKIKTLNILLDLNDDVEVKDSKTINNYKIKSMKDLRDDNNIAGLFPRLKIETIKKDNSLDSFINITNDLSNSNLKKNKEYENIFKPKKLFVAKTLIIINIILYILGVFDSRLVNFGILIPNLSTTGEYYRLITAMFFHGNIFHLGMNMYALYVLGSQVENYIGKFKFFAIYMLSGITGSMLSCILTNSYSLGASGAIFGIMGCLLYFGIRYRVYLGNVLMSQIVPIIVLNLLFGFIYTGIDNFAHIGGLVGGIFLSMSFGVDNKQDKVSRINGTITFIIYIVFLTILLVK